MTPILPSPSLSFISPSWHYTDKYTPEFTRFSSPPSAFLSTLLPFLQGPAFVIPELLFSRCFVGYAHLRSTTARFKNAASLGEGVM